MKRALCFLLVVVYVTGKVIKPYALLTDVKTLTLYRGRMTNGGRSSPVKQLDCVSGDACKHFTPEVVNCVNVGIDDKGEVQWKCQAQMEDYYRLGQTQVSCEGYTSSEDPYILTGSCGVEYTLHLTQNGKKHHAPKRRGHQGDPGVQGLSVEEAAQLQARRHIWAQQKQKSDQEQRTQTMNTLAGVILTIICIVILWKLCDCTDQRPAQVHHHVAPAVVVQPPANYGNGFAPPGQRAYVAPPVVVQASSGPGFWSGYWMGGGGGRRTTHHHHSSNYTPSHSTPSSSSYSSSSGSGWGSSSSHSSPSPSSSSSSSSSGGSSYTSTGFGGTKKR